jgi:transposase
MPMRESLFQMWALYSRLEDDFQVMNKGLRHLTGQDNVCKKFMKLEGVGPITSMRLKIKLGGGKVQLGSVGENSCDKPLRSCLFLGARAVVAKLKKKSG